MARKHYKFTNKKHPLPAIMATILGVISLFGLGYGILSSYLQKGNVPARYGMAGVLIMLYSMVGLVISLITIRDPEQFKLFSVLGILFNGLSLLVLVFLLWLPT